MRALYYQALGAQRLVEVRSDLAKIARQAVNISHQPYNVGQADQPDVLEASIESQRAELVLVAAQNDRERVWRQLASVVGMPSLRPASLAGRLDDSLPALDRQSALETILRERALR